MSPWRLFNVLSNSNYGYFSVLGARSKKVQIAGRCRYLPLDDGTCRQMPVTLNWPLPLHLKNVSTDAGTRWQMPVTFNWPLPYNYIETPDSAHILHNIKLENMNRLVIGHLNVNSMRNKFEALKCIIKENLDILVISETKLDDTFPKNQFTLDGWL